MKKYISLLLIAILMINLLPISGTAAGAPQYVVEDKTVQVGDTFTVDVTIQENPGIISLRFKIVYDTEVLELQSVENKGLLNGFTPPAPTITSPYTLRWADSLATVNNTAQGTVATLTFKALQATNSTSVTIEHGESRNATGTKVAFSNATANVTVKEIPVDVTGVTLNKETLSLKTGESEILIATVSPDNATNKTISWKSSDTTIATVDNNGKVEAVKKGTATITVTTEDGSFTDTCTVNVACSHANKTPIAEKASDCKNQGWDAYVKCDDCGQLFKADGTTEIAEIPFRPLSERHTGGTATCTKQAVCTVCGNPYGNTIAHSYTAETKKTEALKTEGNCRDKAVYYYSCVVCGRVENNDSHTFNGDKVSGTHVGGTTLVNPSEANHNTQTDGYTGDTKCLGCGEILDYGEPIPADAHIPANIWSNDADYHWKECTVVGCGIVIDASKVAHSSTGDNVATCQKLAVCDVCGVSYGTAANHDWNTTSWEKDASGHWHKCNTAGCTEKNAFDGHTPDHQGGATEEYAIKCTVCQYEIEAQLGHTHVFDKEVVAEQYLASKANCTDPAKYYKSCKCGEKGSETFATGEALGHTEGNAWEKDATHHWHICTIAGCGVIIDSSKAAHTPDRDADTETDPIKCSVCGYVITPALGHTHAHGTEWKSDKDNHWNECACGDKANTAAHTDTDKDGKCDICGYNVGLPADPSNPQTGDSSTLSLWIILLCVSALGIVATTVLSKKKSFR